MRHVRARGDVGEGHHRIGWSFQEDDLCVRLDRVAHCLDPRGVDVAELQAEFLQHPAEEPVRSAVHVFAGDDGIAGLEHAKNHIDRRHARGEAVAVLAPLQRCQIRLQHAARRVLGPRVLITFVLAEPRLHIG